MAIRGRIGSRATATGSCVDVGAGEDWDALVARAVEERLARRSSRSSGIPGLVGATPIQNVGAYGQEVSETIVRVRAFDRAARRVRRHAPGPSAGSATARASSSATSRCVVTRVRFALDASEASAPVRYAELARALGVKEGERARRGGARDGARAAARQGDGARSRPIPTR